MVGNNGVSYTMVDNSVIDKYIPQIGLSGLGVLVIIKRYLNQKTGQCNPSYATIARKSGVDRSTIIRYVKKLKAFNLLDPELRFKEDGSPSSNQYNFPSSPSSGTPPVNRHEQDDQDKGGAVLPPLQEQGCHSPSGIPATTPSAPLPPEQSSSSNKKERTREIPALPTERQKTCPHPPTEIVILPDDITICHHCWGLLDEDFKLREEDKPPEIKEAA